MRAWQGWMALALTAACSAAAAQSVVEKPAASRFYGTARPPAVQQPAPSAPVHTPPPSYAPPPQHRPGPPPAVYHRPPPPRVGVDVVIGSPYPRPYYGPRPWYPAYPAYPGYGYPPPMVYPPPVIVSPPPVYIERPPIYVERPLEPQPPSAPASGFWYWCAEPQGWYPEIGDCPQGWQAVPPRAAQ